VSRKEIILIIIKRAAAFAAAHSFFQKSGEKYILNQHKATQDMDVKKASSTDVAER
jgi:hypothetical protein